MRSVKTANNIFTGLTGQLLYIALGFVTRTIFIKTLGSAYLGINGLFMNILSILSVSELGIGTAIVYSLYKPLAVSDIPKVKALMNLYRRTYFYIGCIIMVLGFLLLPFLPVIIKNPALDISSIKLIFILFLFQSVSSYWFFSYRSVILTATQKNYVIAKINYGITLSLAATQIAALFFFRELLTDLQRFILYVFISFFYTVLKNLLVSRKSEKEYPYIKDLKRAELDKAEKKSIFKNVYGLAMYKISGIVTSSTDNVVISTFVGITAVGYYSNYLLIIHYLSILMYIIFSSFTSGIGNLYATESREKSEFIFRCLNFLNFWVYGFCSVCLFVLFNPFITLWVGKNFLFGQTIVLIIVINFVTSGLQDAVISFKDACGLFRQGRYRPVFTAILNIAFSLILVNVFKTEEWKICGVLLGTIISRFLTIWWFDPWMVYKHAFGMSARGYYFRYFRSFFIIVITGGFCFYLSSFLNCSPLLNFVLQAGICLLVPNAFFFILFRKTEEFKYLYDSLRFLNKKALNRIKKKRTGGR